jgi:hypothetical protein
VLSYFVFNLMVKFSTHNAKIFQDFFTIFDFFFYFYFQAFWAYFPKTGGIGHPHIFLNFWKFGDSLENFSWRGT